MPAQRLSTKCSIFFLGGLILLNPFSLASSATEFSINPVYKNVYENDRVRVYEMTFTPGSKWVIRKPRHDYLIYVLEGDEFSLLHPDNNRGIATAQAGKVLWFSGHPSTQRNAVAESAENLDLPMATEIKHGSLQGRWSDDHYQKAENNSLSVVRILVMEFK